MFITLVLNFVFITAVIISLVMIVIINSILKGGGREGGREGGEGEGREGGVLVIHILIGMFTRCPYLPHCLSCSIHHRSNVLQVLSSLLFSP